MTLRIGIRRISHLGALLGLAFLGGCGEEGSNPTAPASSKALPIEIRADAATYGPQDDLTVMNAWIVGRTLTLQVAHGGGCRAHTFAAAAAPHFLESYPAQLPVFLKHDADNDLCAAYLLKTLTFDVSPAIQLHQQAYGSRGPFYLRISAPGETEPTKVLVR